MKSLSSCRKYLNKASLDRSKGQSNAWFSQAVPIQLDPNLIATDSTELIANECPIYETYRVSHKLLWVRDVLEIQ